MVLGILSYFCLVTAVLALLFLPGARAWAARGVQRVLASGRAAASCAASASQTQLVRVAGTIAGGSARGVQVLRHNRRICLLSTVMLALALLLPLALQHWRELDGFDHTASHEMNEQILALLHGEQLVPPAPLPPEMFSTPEVEAARPLIRQASRQWELLDETFRQRLLVVFKLMQETHGYEMVLLEGYRSPERQARLAALGSHVTQAAPFESYHQFGLAADCAFKRGGRLVISEADPWAARGYENLGAVARSVGLTWGGGWRSIKDLGHVELSRPGVLQRANAAAAAARASSE